jgi:UDP-galactopyranose mutase
MKKPYDYLIVGSGLFGATFAYMAHKYGKRCLVIERRKQLGGNVACQSIEGIDVHLYGPHIFHTSNKEVWNMVSSIVPMNHFVLCTIANYHGQIYNLPFNMNTFYQMWGVTTPKEAHAKLEEQQKNMVNNLHPLNLEEQAIKLVGMDIYEKLIKGYTEKQWGRLCNELPAFIIQRLPVRFTYDNNYFNDIYQGIPEGGYNRLINGLLENIECKTECNYLNNRVYWNSLANKIVFTGAIDEFFDYKLGRLEYRSLKFEHEIKKTKNWQGNAIINYTANDIPFTRIVEHKHFQINNPEVLLKPITIITKEYPIKCNHSEPYYPVNDSRNNYLYKEYSSLTKNYNGVIFGGRLATYQYMNMDEVIYEALKLFRKDIGGL